MKVYIHFFSSIMLSMVFFYSCASNPSAESKKDFLTNQQIPDSKKIKLLLEQGHPSLSLPKEERQKLYQLYQNSGFQPFFDSTTQSEQIQQRWTNSLSKAMYFGLNALSLMSSILNGLCQSLLMFKQSSTVW